MSFGKWMIRRAFGLLVGAALLGPAVGCTNFQSMTTSKWFDGAWMDVGGEMPVNQVVTVWDNHIRVAPDSQHVGVNVPLLAGRMYLLNEEAHSCVEAHGMVVAQMYDMTPLAKGESPIKLAEWTYKADALRGLKQKDSIGEGYTLVLPWDNYRPDIKDVQIQLCYLPVHGPARYTEPQRLALQTLAEADGKVTQRKVVPALEPRRVAPVAAPQSITADQRSAPVIMPQSQVQDQRGMPVILPQSQAQDQRFTPPALPQPQARDQRFTAVPLPQPQAPDQRYMLVSVPQSQGGWQRPAGPAAPALPTLEQHAVTLPPPGE
jgi:hypothetical protein